MSSDVADGVDDATLITVADRLLANPVIEDFHHLPRLIPAHQARKPNSDRELPSTARGVGVQELVQQLGVDVAEVGRDLEVPVVQVRQRRRSTVEAAFDRAPGDEYRAGCAVVGALRGVCRDSAAEFE